MLYSIQTPNGISFDIYLNEDFTEEGKILRLQEQFEAMFPDYIFRVYPKEYGFQVRLNCNNKATFIDIVKQ